jgi:hypothetical protein
MSVLVLDLVFRAQIMGREKHALIGLANYADDNGYCFPFIATVAADVGYTRYTIKRGLKDAEQNGRLTRNARHKPDGFRTSDGYQINLDALRALARPDEKSGGQQFATDGGQQSATHGGEQFATHGPQQSATDRGHQNGGDGEQQFAADKEPSSEPSSEPSPKPSMEPPEEEKPEAADATSPAAPGDARDEVWRSGVNMMAALRVPNHQARKNIGRWLKEGYDRGDILEAIGYAFTQGSGDPIALINKSLQSKAKRSSSGKQDPMLQGLKNSWGNWDLLHDVANDAPSDPLLASA